MTTQTVDIHGGVEMHPDLDPTKPLPHESSSPYLVNEMTCAQCGAKAPFAPPDLVGDRRCTVGDSGAHDWRAYARGVGAFDVTKTFAPKTTPPRGTVWR